MSLDILRQLIDNSCFLQTYRSLAGVEILHICRLVFFLILLKDACQRAMFLQKLFFAVGELTFLEIVHDVEILS